MALRVGQPPSAGTWIFFERAFQAAAKDPERFNPTDPFEESRRLDNPVQFRLISARYYLIILGVYLCFMVIWSTVAATLAAGRGMWLLAGLITAVVGVSLFYYLRFRHRRNKRRAFSAGSLEALSPLVKQAQRGTFNGFDAYPYARMYAEATYRRQQMGLDLENALPFEVQICHDIGVLPRGKAFVRRAHENEVRAVDPIIFSGLDFSTERKQERNRFLGSLLEQAQKEDSLRVGEIISTRSGVVVADIKWWNGTLSLARDDTIVDANLGSEELSRYRSICALVDSAPSQRWGSRVRTRDRRRWQRQRRKAGDKDKEKARYRRRVDGGVGGAHSPGCPQDGRATGHNRRDIGAHPHRGASALARAKRSSYTLECHES